AAWNHLAERPALDIFHDNEVPAILTGDVVDGDDVGMVQGRRRFGFLCKAPFAIRICHEFGRKYLDSDEAVQMLVARLVDNSHSTLAKTRKDLVVTQTLSYQTPQRRCCFLSDRESRRAQSIPSLVVCLQQ